MKGDEVTTDRIETIFDLISELPERYVVNKWHVCPIILFLRIARPYSQTFRLSVGSTRMTDENWHLHFPEESYLELFRFRKADINVLATALEVKIIFKTIYHTFCPKVPDSFVTSNNYRSCK